MNAAFLLVTSALLVGQKGEAVPPPAAGKPATVASSCGTECCDGFGHRLRDKLGGLFNRGCNDNCRPRCFDGHRLAAFRNNCDQCCKPKIWTWNRHCKVQNCAPQTCNDPCNRRGLQILEKLQHCFQRRDRCCDGGCSTPGVIVAPKAGEKIDPPKKMPVEAPKNPRPSDVNINNVPSTIAPLTPPAAPDVPRVEVQPNPPVPPITAPTTTVPPIVPPARDPNDSSRAPF